MSSTSLPCRPPGQESVYHPLLNRCERLSTHRWGPLAQVNGYRGYHLCWGLCCWLLCAASNSPTSCQQQRSGSDRTNQENNFIQWTACVFITACKYWRRYKYMPKINRDSFSISKTQCLAMFRTTNQKYFLIFQGGNCKLFYGKFNHRGKVAFSLKVGYYIYIYI